MSDQIDDGESESMRPLTREQIERRWRVMIGNPVSCATLADATDHGERPVSK